MAHLKSLTPKNPSPVLVCLLWFFIIGVGGALGLYGIIDSDWSTWLKLPAAIIVFVLVANLLAALILVFRGSESFSNIEKKILYFACIEMGIVAACPVLIMLIYMIGYIVSLFIEL